MFPTTSRLPRPTAEAGCEPSGSSRPFSSDVFLSRSFRLLPDNDDENVPACRLPCVCDPEPGAPAPMGDRIWITDAYRPGPSHPRRRSCSSSTCHASHWLIASCLQTKDLSSPTATALLQLAISLSASSLTNPSDSPACAKPSRTMIRISTFRG